MIIRVIYDGSNEQCEQVMDLIPALPLGRDMAQIWCAPSPPSPTQHTEEWWPIIQPFTTWGRGPCSPLSPLHSGHVDVC
jgi:hypothetical protein